MWFAEYVIADGTLHAHGRGPAPEPGPGRAVKTWASDQSGVWNPATLEYDPREKQLRIAPHEFLLLMTRAERLALAASTDNALRDAVFLMQMMVGAGLEPSQGRAVLDQMQSAGIINAARKAAIIDAARD